MKRRRPQYKHKVGSRSAYVLIGLLLAGCAGFVLARRMAQNTLLRHATRYADARGYNSIFLLSDHEVLVLPSPYKEAFRIDMRTGASVRLTALSLAMRRVPACVAHLSPDKRWLQWEGSRNTVPHDRFQIVMALDGSQYWEWPDDSFHSGYSRRIWTPQSDALIHSECDGKQFQITWQRCDTSKTVCATTPIPAGSPLLQPLNQKRFGMATPDIEPLAWTDAHHLLIFSYALPAATTLSFYEIDTSGQAKPARRWDVKLPRNHYASEITFSPTGKRVAWVTADNLEQSDNSMLRRVGYRWPALLRYPVFNPQRHSKLWMYTSRLDGSEMRELGCVEQNNDPMTHDLGFDPKERMENLQWTPDGKNLLFVYDGAIYTVLDQ